MLLLQAAVGDEWQIFLCEDKEEKPTAIVLPASAREGVISRSTEVSLTLLFAALTAVTTVNSAGVPLIDFLVDPFHTSVTSQVGVWVGGRRGGGHWLEVWL